MHAALINSHVTSWMQDEIRNVSLGRNKILSIVYEIKQLMPVWTIEWPLERIYPNIRDCYNEYYEEIVVEPMRLYYRHTEVLFVSVN